MKIIDISWPISKATTGYKDLTLVKFHDLKNFATDGVRETEIQLSSHTGTHIDAPSHMMRDGKTIDQLDLRSCIGPCTVVDMTEVGEKITGDDLERQNIREGDIVLLKTTNSALSEVGDFYPYFVFLDVSGAQYLATKKVKAVGIDYLGIERNDPDHLTHHELMKHDIAIIEGLRLAHVVPGTYLCCCLPLYTIGLEAAPARAVLLEE